ncbi:Rad17-domain-containing protein [Aaosphaeria arxii CBS 175.79]|uniref:Rad17-domain-containing protein n=1 Tax=Aaosphaeria arxii CBS 175.79 TaxID=1450172 RepID=A0A6A5XK43_9PLEO|nr:Rad17-domain-containing protein [Aaosphaeria arxii CBS 175.79]KAF2013177.1 Rad17-domain-containing protein [Aaosphaeria arxii CBS 175.79]
MGKPRAAREKPVVLSSDEDDGPYSPPPKRPKRGTLTAPAYAEPQNSSEVARPRSRAQGGHASKARQTSSNQRSSTKSPQKAKPTHKPITSFFSNVPRSQIAQPSPSPEKISKGESLEDIDDIFDSSEDDPQLRQPKALAVRKRQREASVVNNDTTAKGSSRFLRTNNGSQSTPSTQLNARQLDVDSRPWNEKYGPQTLDELAVHKRKVSDVRAWLLDTFSGQHRKRLLLLKGPAGSGKTATVSLLAKELSIDVHEWSNPAGASASTEGFVSITAQFEDFVGRTGNFGSLAMVDSSQSQPNPPKQQASRPSGRNHLIVVEEFPNTFARASTAVQSFRSAVLNFLASTTPSSSFFLNAKSPQDHSITPMVMIISETLLSTNTAAADSFTAHRLLGPEILNHEGVSVIEFNSIATTIMTKALTLTVNKEARQSGRKKTVGPQVIQQLSNLGDIRSAVSSLEFLCVRGDEHDGWGGKITFAKKKGNTNIPLTKMEKESLEMITQRESTLGIFHAVGKVVYNKRVQDAPNELPVPQPPPWFPERRRPKRSEVDVDSLIDEIGTDTHTFIAALHENYPLSCTGADSEETMDSIEGCMEALSDADLLSPDRFSTAGFGKQNFQGSSSDSLRQEEMSFQVSVLGMLYSLPSPVKRAANPSGTSVMKGKGSSVFKMNSHSMYYPDSLRIWRTQEELGGLLDLWVSRIRRNDLLSSDSVPKYLDSSSTAGVESWKSSGFHAGNSGNTATDESSPLSTLLGSGGSARFETLLERLPYLYLILRGSTSTSRTPPKGMREIEKLVTFGGSAAMYGDEKEDDYGDSDEHEQWATDLPAPTTPQKRRRHTVGLRKTEHKSPTSMIVARDVATMTLSDDDIED